MTELFLSEYVIEAADVGPENPHPMFRGPADDMIVPASAQIPEEERRFLGWRTAFRILPHRVQDGYSRRRDSQGLPSIVLQNRRLRATVLPAMGGRLVSLIDRTTGRETLFRNPIFQPGNLALRNAWFAGGIEWNAGQFGHHVLTCAPVHAYRITGPDGEPGLRLAEWDRAKGFTWQVDLHLPEGAGALVAYVRIENPHPYELPMYWWTNIAVPETGGGRVIVPAESGISGVPDSGFELVDVPGADGDVTYPARRTGASECFFRLPAEERRWIAAVDENGSGFFETSTMRLIGRKLFCWGRGAGGRRWQEFLSGPGASYLEIQAGLARTQVESVPMPPSTVWDWVEAFGPINLTAEDAHSSNWSVARSAAASAIERAAGSESSLEAYRAACAEVGAAPPGERLRVGSGWAALERRRCAAAGQPATVAASLATEDSDLGPEQQPWLLLLERGRLPSADRLALPYAYMTQPEWRVQLEQAATVRKLNWAEWLHLGVMRMEARDTDGARTAFARSNAALPNAWALRNLAWVARCAGETAEAIRLLQAAVVRGPANVGVADELLTLLGDAGDHAQMLAVLEALPADVREDGRIRLAAVRALTATGDLDGAEALLAGEIPTIREGEVSLTDLWFEVQARRRAEELGVEVDAAIRLRTREELRAPEDIDFRMSAGPFDS